MSEFIEVEQLRNSVLYNKILEVLGKINIEVTKIPSHVLNEMTEDEKSFLNKHVDTFILAVIDQKYEMLKCIFKTLSFKDSKLSFALNSPFDLFYSE